MPFDVLPGQICRAASCVHVSRSYGREKGWRHVDLPPLVALRAIDGGSRIIRSADREPVVIPGLISWCLVAALNVV